MAGLRRKDYTGHKHGKVTWIKPLGKSGTNVLWEVKCDCGTVWKLPTFSARKVKSCGCVHWAGIQDSVHKSMFAGYKRGAEKRNLEFKLSFEDFKNLASKDCDYCGTPPEHRRYSRSQRARPVNGIDRINSGEGYTLENCVPCCKACNFIKSDLSLGEFLKKVEMIYLKRVKT